MSAITSINKKAKQDKEARLETILVSFWMSYYLSGVF